MINLQGLRNLIIITLISVVVWVGYEVYKTTKKEVIPEIETKHAQPIRPEINTDILENLPNRTTIE